MGSDLISLPALQVFHSPGIFVPLAVPEIHSYLPPNLQLSALEAGGKLKNENTTKKTIRF